MKQAPPRMLSGLPGNWWGSAGAVTSGGSIAGYLLNVVNAGLCGVVFVAPYIFGGRHDAGRLVLLLLIAVTASAWFVRQALLPAAKRPRTAAYWLLLIAAGLLLLQIIPLPNSVLSFLSPRTVELLPLWTPGGNESADLGTWRTLSLIPHETKKSLAMLLGYGMLFAVVAERIQDRADIKRLLRWIGISAAIMAVFGVVQYFTSDGLFLWFYRHPHRSTTYSLAGPFINHNHFSNFMVLGVGPLAGWLLSLVRSVNRETANRHRRLPAWKLTKLPVRPLLVGGGLTFILFSILLSLSRGGTLALVIAVVTLGTIYVHARLVDSKYLFIAVGVGVVLIGLLSLYGYDQVSVRLSSLTQGADEIDHNEGRRKIWRANFSAIWAGGLFGSGAGSHAAIYPLYLPQSLPYEYTHAENGFLQVATETGVVGAAVLVLGLGACTAWGLACFRNARSEEDRLYFGALAAGLVASVAHSFVDFVWYIPACISVTIVLAACLLRLSQFVSATENSNGMQQLPRGRWIEVSAAAVVIGVWMVHSYVGPGMAAIYWDRYLFASNSNSVLARQHWSELSTTPSATTNAESAALNKLMLRQLMQVISWDPHFAKARLRLAAKCIAEFDIRQQAGPNRMTTEQVRDAAIASSFKSAAEVQSWLRQTFGNDVDLLRRAQSEARLAVSLCPLQGEAYLHLADLCFLDASPSSLVDAYVEQGLLVRPNDAFVLYEAGKHELAAGNVAAAQELWKRCFANPGPQQLKIVYLLAGRIPADIFLSTFEPDWHSLWHVWRRYRESGTPHEIDAILAYSASETEKVAERSPGHLTGALHNLSIMYAAASRNEQAIACLERAYACDPLYFPVRESLARTLTSAERFAEAEAHFRWCLARRPADKGLSDALMNVTKMRLAKRETPANGSRGTASWNYLAPGRERRAESPEPGAENREP